MKHTLPITLLVTAGFTASSMASTTFLGGNLKDAANWDNGFPSAGNEGSIAVDGALVGTSLIGYGGDTVVNMTAGTITPDGNQGFNVNGGGTWNISGGAFNTRYFLSNGASTTFNLSGGTVTLHDVDSTQHAGVANNGTLNLSGSAVIDGTFATVEVQTAGTLDIASDWSGTWIWGPYTAGTEWEELFTSGQMTLDGNTLDAAGFGSSFQVTGGGTTLSAVPEPSVGLLGALAGLALLRRRRHG